MPTPTTNISLLNIFTEFSTQVGPWPPPGYPPIPMAAYYRGGVTGYVPSNQATSATDGTPISTSGAIRVGMFRGLTKTPSGSVPASASGTWDTEDYEYGGLSSFASISFLSDGSHVLQGNNIFGVGTGQSWYSPNATGIGSSYWVRATVTGGSLTGGTAGTWLSLSTTRTWSVSRSSQGITDVTLTFEFATDSGGSNIVATHTNNYMRAFTNDGPQP